MITNACPGSTCPDCAAKDATIAELAKALRARPQTITIEDAGRRTVYRPIQTETFYDRCPCNPKNGGSGICGCIRGSQTIC